MLLCDEGRVDSVLCKEFKAALEARSDAQALKQRILSIENAPLDGLLLDQINTGYIKGEEDFESEYFGDAARRFEASVKGYSRVLSQYEIIREDKLREADQLLDEKQFDLALKAYKLVETWEASDDTKQGIELASRGIKEGSTLRQIDKLVEEEKFSEALGLLSTISSPFFSADKKQFQKKIGQGELEKIGSE